MVTILTSKAREEDTDMSAAGSYLICPYRRHEGGGSGGSLTLQKH